MHRQLLRHQLMHHVHQVVQRVALDVEFTLGPGLHELGQVMHIGAADMALVGSGMHRDAVRTGLQTQRGGARDAGDAQVARVAHQRDFVEVD